jgi:hypothetical protein
MLSAVQSLLGRQLGRRSPLPTARILRTKLMH